MLKIEIYQDGSGEWRWRAFEANNRIIADSAEGYVTRQGVEAAVDNVMIEFRANVSVVTRSPRRAEHAAKAEAVPSWEVLSEYEAEGAKPRG